MELSNNAGVITMVNSKFSNDSGNFVNDELHIGILRNERPDSAEDWIKACESRNISYTVIDLSSNSWLEQVLRDKYDFFVLQPSGYYERFKTMYDERLYIICNVLKLKTFPSYAESLIYENKKVLSYYLQSRMIPHPKTWVFYSFNEVQEFVAQSIFPIVAKTSIGASESGVKIIRTKDAAFKYISIAFKGKGINRRFGPNRVTGNPKKWIKKTIASPKYFINRLRLYFEVLSNAQFGYVILQEYIPHDFEWRIVKIGESYFAHKKIKVVDKASGGKVKQFGFPDKAVIDFVDDLCEKNQLNSVCVDVFESANGYLVNEIQCIFGIPYGYLMKVGDEIGRLRKINDEWEFEGGDFTSNNCCDLRLDTALLMFQNDSANR